MSALLIALQFLTRLPLPAGPLPGPQALGRSLLYYPLVGLLLGGLLGLGAWLLQPVAQPLQAALLLLLWIALTGILHLDGLADSADAWLGGLGNRERTLAIMQDPRSGPMAIVVLALLLLLKFSALQLLLAHQQWLALPVTCLLGRTALLALLLTTPYVRPGGLGQVWVEQLPRQAAWLVLLASLAGAGLLAGAPGFGAVLLAIAAFGLLRQRLLVRLGGTTGDTAGAMLELVEGITLVGWAVLNP